VPRADDDYPGWIIHRKTPRGWIIYRKTPSDQSNVRLEGDEAE
jgi:hypothetical protein